MSRKILFFLSSDKFHAQIWKNGELGRPIYFLNSAEGLEQLSDFLRSHRDPTYILVDLIEEDFRHEVVPHLTGSNHHDLVLRKFEQYYRSTPFRLARRQRRQSEGRRDDEILFSALTNPARITAWLELLLLHETPIAGIYSLPHASIPLVKEIEYDQLLLLSWEKDAGLRQSYYYNQRLRFSRLTPLNPNTSFAEAVAAETARTYQYLQSLSLAPRGEKLKAHIICHAQDKELLDSSLTSNNNINYAYIDLQQLGKRLKSKNTFTDSDATPIFLHQLAIKPPRGNYASSEHRHFYFLWQTKRALFGLAAATALVCIVWSGFAFMQSRGVDAEIETLNLQTNHIMAQSREITQGFQNDIQNKDGSIVTATDMKTAVTLFRKLQFYSVPPQTILKELTFALDSFPRIHTTKLAWQANNLPGSSYPSQVVTFNGELTGFGINYRGALDYLERFQLALTRAGYTVTPVKMPLDFSSKGSISADIREGSDKPSEFSLKIIWRPQE
jgi:hypothetical protein